VNLIIPRPKSLASFLLNVADEMEGTNITLSNSSLAIRENLNNLEELVESD